jgi:uncharacterized RDD family membrane protein YckC
METEAPERSEGVVGALDVPLDLPLAHVGTRALAVLVDTLILVAILIALAASAALLGETLSLLLGGWGIALFAWAAFLAFWGYFVLSEQLMGGQTWGKRLVGLRVVAADGTDVGLLASLVRNLLRVIDVVPGTYGIGVATMLLSRRGQRLGDMAAGTLVVRERSGRMAAPVAERVWPEGFGVSDVALVEHFFRVRDTLRPETRERLGRRLLEWLARDHPRLLEGQPTDAPPSVLVHRIFTPSILGGRSTPGDR